MRILPLLWLCSLPFTAFPGVKDSLISLIRAERDSSVKAGHYVQLLIHYRSSGNAPAFHGVFYPLESYFRSTRSWAKLGIVYREKAWFYRSEQRMDSFEHYTERSFESFQKSGSSIWMAEAWWLKGNYELVKSDYAKAIGYYIQGLNTVNATGEKEKNADLKNYHRIIFNLQLDLSAAYIEQRDYSQAHKILSECESLSNQVGDFFMIGKVHNALGGLYYYENNFDESAKQFMAAARAFDQAKDYSSLYDAYNNIGLVYQEKGDYKSALFWMEQSLESSLRLNRHLEASQSYFNLGEIYSSMNQPDKAEEYYSKSLDVAMKILNKNQQMHNYKALAELYGKTRRFEKAFDLMREYASLKDTILNEERNKAITEMQTKYDTEKKEQENLILKEQQRSQELVNSRQRMVIFGVSGISLLALVLAVLIYRGYQQKKIANVVLAEKNTVIEQKSRIVEEQNKDIKDSIRYAKRLQEAILPGQNRLYEWFPDSFILFRPKDIVSGDFYWFEKFGDQVFIAAADCTGHGVPGAFMSIMGSNLLNQALNEYALTRTDAILNSVNKGLAKALRTQGEAATSVKDGMDIALCSIDTKRMLLEYSGAFNPAWIFRGGEMLELPANKFPVGENAYGEVKMFDMQTWSLQKGDRVYVFTDGLADQFGGPKGKKFKYKPFMELLKLAENMPMQQQSRLLVSTIDEWRGNLEQVDDILVIGVRV